MISNGSPSQVPAAIQPSPLLSPKGHRCFLDLCAGVCQPLSLAISKQGLMTCPIDVLLCSHHDILSDSFFEQLLRLAASGLCAYTAASPSYHDYILFSSGDSHPLRTKEFPCGVPNLNPSEQSRLLASKILVERCVQCLEASYLSGGHGHFEHPLHSLCWQEQLGP